MKSLRLSGTLAFVFLLVPALYAQNNRSAVSINGNDLNSCIVPAPCRTFSAAMALTNPGGEIIALDSGGYGPFIVNKPVTVQPVPGAYAAIAPATGDAITINALAGDDVVLRGLTLTGLGAAIGISFNTANSLYVDKVQVSGFSTRGISFVFASTATLVVKDSLVNDSGFGIWVETSSGRADANIEGTYLTNNVSNGIRADDNSKVTIRGTVAINNGYGFIANCGGTSTCDMTIESSVVSGSGLTGVAAGSLGGTATIRLSNSTVTYNATGLSFTAGQNLLTRGNNTVEGNTTNGAFSGSFTAK